MNAKDFLTAMDAVNYSYQLIINEPGQSFFIDRACQIVAGQLDEFQYKIVKMVTHHYLNDKKIGLFEYKGQLIGWFEIKDSIQLLNKKNEHILVDIEAFKTPAINHQMKIKGDLTLAFRNFNLSSKYFIIIENKILEAVYSGTRFLGFVPAEVISRSKVIQEQCYLKPIHSKVYATAKCDDEIIGVNLDYEQPVKLEEIFPGTSVVKIRQDNITGWVNQDMLDIKLSLEEHEYTLNERIVEHMMMTYAEERNRHKTIIKKLLNESMTLRSRLIKMDKKLSKTDVLYNNLKNSKLGKIQIAFWQRRRKG